jgi:ketosteroid isomerase-like protein
MMRNHVLGLAAGVAACSQVIAADDAGAREKAAGMSAAECEVWERELSFSKTVARHDEAAFTEHVHAGAVFAAGSAEPQRGRAAVVERWREIIEGKAFALHWRPGHVAIGGDPDIALSSGPAWIEDFDPKATQRWTISRFTSTWVRDKDGRWRVMFDGSSAPPKPATAEEVAKLAASQPATCPRAP